MRSFVFYSRLGCLLPFLIISNLFFGWIFFKLTHWVLLELGLVLLFMLNIVFLAKKIKTMHPQPGNGKVIDVEGEVVEDRHKLN